MRNFKCLRVYLKEKLNYKKEKNYKTSTTNLFKIQNMKCIKFLACIIIFFQWNVRFSGIVFDKMYHLMVAYQICTIATHPRIYHSTRYCTAIASLPMFLFLYLHDILHKTIACSTFLHEKSDRRNPRYFEYA